MWNSYLQKLLKNTASDIYKRFIIMVAIKYDYKGEKKRKLFKEKNELRFTHNN